MHVRLELDYANVLRNKQREDIAVAVRRCQQTRRMCYLAYKGRVNMHVTKNMSFCPDKVI